MAIDETQQWRQQLAGLINKVPPSISTASIQSVRAYKESIIKARKAMESSRSTAMQLQGFVNQLRQYQ